MKKVLVAISGPLLIAFSHYHYWFTKPNPPDFERWPIYTVCWLSLILGVCISAYASFRYSDTQRILIITFVISQIIVCGKFWNEFCVFC